MSRNIECSNNIPPLPIQRKQNRNISKCNLHTKYGALLMLWSANSAKYTLFDSVCTLIYLIIYIYISVKIRRLTWILIEKFFFSWCSCHCLNLPDCTIDRESKKIKFISILRVQKLTTTKQPEIYYYEGNCSNQSSILEKFWCQFFNTTNLAKSSTGQRNFVYYKINKWKSVS